MSYLLRVDGQVYEVPDDVDPAEAAREIRARNPENRIASNDLENLPLQLQSGLGSMQEGLGGLFNLIGSPFGTGTAGQAAVESGQRMQNEARARYSPELARDLSQEDPNPDDLIPNITNLRQALNTVIESAPSMAATIGPAAGLRALGVGPRVAAGVASGTEGALMAGGSEAAIQQQIRDFAASDPEAFLASEPGQYALAIARERGMLEDPNVGDFLVETAARRAAGLTPLAVGGLGAAIGGFGGERIVGGLPFARQAGQRAMRAIPEFARPIVGQAASEGAEEMLQSGIESLALNAAVQQVDPSRPLTRGLADAVALGGIAGGIGGGTFGAMDALSQLRRPQTPPPAPPPSPPDGPTPAFTSADDLSSGAFPQTPPPPPPPAQPGAAPGARQAARQGQQDPIDTVLRSYEVDLQQGVTDFSGYDQIVSVALNEIDADRLPSDLKREALEAIDSGDPESFLRRDGGQSLLERLAPYRMGAAPQQAAPEATPEPPPAEPEVAQEEQQEIENPFNEVLLAVKERGLPEDYLSPADALFIARYAVENNISGADAFDALERALREQDQQQEAPQPESQAAEIAAEPAINQPNQPAQESQIAEPRAAAPTPQADLIPQEEIQTLSDLQDAANADGAPPSAMEAYQAAIQSYGPDRIKATLDPIIERDRPARSPSFEQQVLSDARADLRRLQPKPQPKAEAKPAPQPKPQARAPQPQAQVIQPVQEPERRPEAPPAIRRAMEDYRGVAGQSPALRRDAAINLLNAAQQAGLPVGDNRDSIQARAQRIADVAIPAKYRGYDKKGVTLPENLVGRPAERPTKQEAPSAPEAQLTSLGLTPEEARTVLTGDRKAVDAVLSAKPKAVRDRARSLAREEQATIEDPVNAEEEANRLSLKAGRLRQPFTEDLGYARASYNPDTGYLIEAKPSDTDADAPNLATELRALAGDTRVRFVPRSRWKEEPAQRAAQEEPAQIEAPQEVEPEAAPEPVAQEEPTPEIPAATQEQEPQGPSVADAVDKLRSALMNDAAFPEAVREVAAQRGANASFMRQVFFDLYNRKGGIRKSAPKAEIVQTIIDERNILRRQGALSAVSRAQEEMPTPEAPVATEATETPPAAPVQEQGEGAVELDDAEEAEEAEAVNVAGISVSPRGRALAREYLQEIMGAQSDAINDTPSMTGVKGVVKKMRGLPLAEFSLIARGMLSGTKSTKGAEGRYGADQIAQSLNGAAFERINKIGWRKRNIGSEGSRLIPEALDGELPADIDSQVERFLQRASAISGQGQQPAPPESTTQDETVEPEDELQESPDISEAVMGEILEQATVEAADLERRQSDMDDPTLENIAQDLINAGANRSEFEGVINFLRGQDPSLNDLVAIAQAYDPELKRKRSKEDMLAAIMGSFEARHDRLVQARQEQNPMVGVDAVAANIAAMPYIDQLQNRGDKSGPEVVDEIERDLRQRVIDGNMTHAQARAVLGELQVQAELPPGARAALSGVVSDFIDNPPKREGGSILFMASDTPQGLSAIEVSEWRQARAKGLDMSQEGRMARAREMGFDTGRALYHGTANAFEAFDERFIGSSDAGFLGRGFYFAKHPETAGHYAGNFGFSALTKERGFADGGNIIPVFIRIKNTFTGTPEQWDKVNEFGYPHREYPAMQAMLNGQSLRDLPASGRFTEVLKSAGFDGVDLGTEVVIFDPANIRSINAAFDPDFRGQTGLLFMAAGPTNYETPAQSLARQFSREYTRRNPNAEGREEVVIEGDGEQLGVRTFTPQEMVRRAAINAAKNLSKIDNLSPFLKEPKLKRGETQDTVDPLIEWRDAFTGKRMSGDYRAYQRTRTLQMYNRIVQDLDGAGRAELIADLQREVAEGRLGREAASETIALASEPPAPVFDADGNLARGAPIWKDIYVDVRDAAIGRDLARRMRARLDAMNMQDVPVSIWAGDMPDPRSGEALPKAVEAYYYNRSIALSTTGINFDAPMQDVEERVAYRLNGEVLHALIDAGVVKQEELDLVNKATIEYGFRRDSKGDITGIRKVKNPKDSILAEIYRNPTYKAQMAAIGGPGAAVPILAQEEAATLAFREWWRLRSIDKPISFTPPVQRFMRKLGGWVKAVVSAFKGAKTSPQQAFSNADEFFEAVVNGEIGLRDRDQARGAEMSAGRVARPMFMASDVPQGLSAIEVSEWRQARAKGLDMSQEARMERAKENGWVTEAFHATGANIKAFRAGDLGIHVGDKETAGQIANLISEGANVMPLLIRGRTFLDAPDLGDWSPANFLSAVFPEETESHPMFPALMTLAERMQDVDSYDPKWQAAVRRLANKHGVTGLRYTNEFEGPGTKSLLIFDPANIRSINAAFDPDFRGQTGLLYMASPEAPSGADQTATGGQSFRMESGFVNGALRSAVRTKNRLPFIKADKKTIQSELSINQEEYDVLELDTFLRSAPVDPKGRVSMDALVRWMEERQYDVSTQTASTKRRAEAYKKLKDETKNETTPLIDRVARLKTPAPRWADHTPFNSDQIDDYIEGSVAFKTGAPYQTQFKGHDFPAGTFGFYQAVIRTRENGEREMVITTVQSDYFDRSNKSAVKSESERGGVKDLKEEQDGLLAEMAALEGQLTAGDPRWERYNFALSRTFEIDQEVARLTQGRNIGEVPFAKSYNKVILKAALDEAARQGVQHVVIVDQETIKSMQGMETYSGKLYDYDANDIEESAKRFIAAVTYQTVENVENELEARVRGGISPSYVQRAITLGFRPKEDHTPNRQTGALTSTLRKLIGNVDGQPYKAPGKAARGTTGISFPLTAERKDDILENGLTLFMAQNPTVPPATAKRLFQRPKILPGQELAGRSAVDEVSDVIAKMKDPFGMEQASKRLASKMVDQSDKMFDSDIGLVRYMGGVLDNFFTLGNLPAQNMYLSLRSMTAGQIQRAQEYAETLTKLRRKMSEDDLTQFRDYMITRNADASLIQNEDVRQAAIATKEIFNLMGEENTRIGRMTKAQHEKYKDRYLPRAYWKYIEKELRNVGIKVGTDGYLKQRGSTDEKMVGLAIEQVGLADSVETMRREVTDMMTGSSDEAWKSLETYFKTGLDADLMNVSMAGGPMPPAMADRFREIRKELQGAQNKINAERFFTLKPVFHRRNPKTGKKWANKSEMYRFGPKAFEERFGEQYVATMFTKAAKNGQSIGRVYEQGAIDGVITDPILLSIKGVQEQVRSLAVYKFFDQIFEAQAAIEQMDIAAGKEPRKLDWVRPGSLIRFRGQLYGRDAFEEMLDSIKKHQPFYAPGTLKRTHADEMVAEMEALWRASEASISTDGRSSRQYERLPDTNDYGNLRGVQVHRAIHKDLTGSLGMTKNSRGDGGSLMDFEDRNARNVLTFFKQSKTTLNLFGGHVRAFLGNMANAYMIGGVGNVALGTGAMAVSAPVMGGVSVIMAPTVAVMPAYIQALREIRADAPEWQEALSMGVKQGTFTEIELRNSLEVLAEIRDQDLQDPGSVMKVINKLARGATSVMTSAAEMYNFWDTTTRYMVYREAVKKGIPEWDAMMNLAFAVAPDYSQVPDWIRFIRNNPFGVIAAPFATWAYKMTPTMLDVAARAGGYAKRMEVPALIGLTMRTAPFFMLVGGIAQLMSYALLGFDNEEEQKAYEATYVEGYRDNVTRVDIPARDSQNNYLSTTLDWLFAWNGPVQGVEHLTNGDILKAASSFIGYGNPILGAGIGAVSGTDTFSGQRLFDEAATDAEKNAARLNYIANSLFLPPGLVGILEPVFETAGYPVRSPYQGWVSMAADKVGGDGISNSMKYIGDWPAITGRALGFNIVNHDPQRRSQSEYRADERNVNNIERMQNARERTRDRRIQEIMRRPDISQRQKERLAEEERRSAMRDLQRLRERELEAFREQGEGAQIRSNLQ